MFNGSIEEIREIITCKWDTMDFIFLCLWHDDTVSWQNTQDLLAGNCDAVINDFLSKLIDNGDTETFKMVFENFKTNKELNDWWETQIQK